MKNSKIKNLFIIGNGFDRWQNLPTSYEAFRQYYHAHIDEIMEKLDLKPQIVTEEDGSKKTITPVELIYGNPFAPNMLPSEFFWTFEVSLDKLDDQRLNWYFGKSNEGIYNLQETIHQAQDILREAFGGWIASIKIEATDVMYSFGEDSYFINFNYTKTLQKRFGIKESKIYHIHGEAEDTESLVFGHATHPEMAFPELIEQKMLLNTSIRLRGLYLVEDALYETDKHIQDNIDDLCEIMFLDGVNIEDIENIYVLGHSFGEPDFEYFDFLSKVTTVGCDYNSLSALWKVQQLGLDSLSEDALLEGIMLNIEYAVHHRDWRLNQVGSRDLKFEKAATEAVRKRFIFEQATRTKEILEELCALVGIDEVPASAECASVLKLAEYIDGGHEKRKRNAKWHISYMTPEDKAQIESVMKRVGCSEYTLYPSVEECIHDFYINKGDR